MTSSSVAGETAASARVMPDSAAPEINRRARQHQLGNFPREARGVGGGEPAALAQSNERCAAAEIVDRHVQVAQIGVDSIIPHLGGRRLPESQSDEARSSLGQDLRQAVSISEIGDRSVVNSVGRDDQHCGAFRPRALSLFEKQHRRKLDANASEYREGRQVDQRPTDVVERAWRFQEWPRRIAPGHVKLRSTTSVATIRTDRPWRFARNPLVGPRHLSPDAILSVPPRLVDPRHPASLRRFVSVRAFSALSAAVLRRNSAQLGQRRKAPAVRSTRPSGGR